MLNCPLLELSFLKAGIVRIRGDYLLSLSCPGHHVDYSGTGEVMIKPGRNDKKYFILITGDELDELKEHAWDFTECFGLNRRIDNYKGKRPMGLYSWDVEAMKEVIGIVMEEPESYPDRKSPEYLAISRLYSRVMELYNEAFKE